MKIATTLKKPKKARNLYNLSKTEQDELGKNFRKYHPQEHDLFDAVDDEYKRNLEKLLGVKIE